MKNIKKHLNGGVPTVLWSGNGYHVHQPLDLEDVLKEAFEHIIPNFARFENPSVKFLRYAEQVLTNGKSDKQHSISFKSCMTRIPDSINTKHECEQFGESESSSSRVKIIQRWNGIRAKPTHEFMLTNFYIWLVDEELHKKKQEMERQRILEKIRQRAPPQFENASNGSSSNPEVWRWIENLVLNGKPLDDYRKMVVALILSRYLINVRRLGHIQSSQIIWQWLNKCAQLRRLKPSCSYFDRYVVHHQLNEAQATGRLPMSLSTMQQKYPELYESLKGAES